MFLSRNKKNNVYLCKPQFYFIKVGFKGTKIIKACFRFRYVLIKTRCKLGLKMVNDAKNVDVAYYLGKGYILFARSGGVCKVFITA